jgi:hypothetical protein
MTVVEIAKAHRGRQTRFDTTNQDCHPRESGEPATTGSGRWMGRV